MSRIDDNFELSLLKRGMRKSIVTIADIWDTYRRRLILRLCYSFSLPGALARQDRRSTYPAVSMATVTRRKLD